MRHLVTPASKLLAFHRYRYLAVLVLAGWAPAQAQFAPSPGGCPPGMYLQGFACVYNRAPSPAPAQAPAPPAAEWATRWGAIAIGSTATGGGFGASTSLPSKRQAEEAATEKCKNTGGGNLCKSFAYYNQCAVVAWGIKNYTLQTAETVDIATDLAMRDCSAKTTDCQLFYSACSLPERVR